MFSACVYVWGEGHTHAHIDALLKASIVLNLPINYQYMLFFFFLHTHGN